jgi:diaminohydroxyphosphoribosylaminopyrimidine deaminase/5-amino-6-(5-phosphoribosylamino)uracil reductase
MAGREEADVTERTAEGRSGSLLPEGVYARALEVGRGASGVSGPNPPVGCVLVREGRIVAEGATGPAGAAHAEVAALAAAGPDAAGATAVLSLEPCAHHGRTPPCVDALVAAGVVEVHVLLRDPDPVAAGGLRALDAAGVRTLDVGAQLPALAVAAAHDLRGFLTRVRSGRPHVTLKLAQAPDGRTQPPAGGYLTGEVARRHVHALRAASDAVLVGGATVRADDPALDVRHIEAARQPRPVILSASGELPAGAKVLRPGCIVATTGGAGRSRLHALDRSDLTVLTVGSDEHGGVDAAEALAALLEHRVLTILAEPGPRLAAVLLGRGLVDTVELHIAGGAGLGADAIRSAVPALAPLLTESSGIERRTTPDGDLLLRAENSSLALRNLEEVA